MKHLRRFIRQLKQEPVVFPHQPKKMGKEMDTVIFRQWKNHPDWGVIALFPEIEGSTIGLRKFIQSYEHIGQHGDADYHGVMLQTRPIDENHIQVQNLIEELTRIGYNLKIRKRASRFWWEKK